MTDDSLPPGFKVIKLKRNGPKPGQTTEQWLYGKRNADAEFDKQAERQKYHQNQRRRRGIS